MLFDNVIILGAGASWDEGIPLMNSFVDSMWRYTTTGTGPHGTISQEDRALLEAAQVIRKELEPYSTRANFNIRNVEDVLSLLSFEAFARGEATERYATWVKAVSRTIEISCKTPFRGSHEIYPENK